MLMVISGIVFSLLVVDQSSSPGSTRLRGRSRFGVA
jgi:hypothetical protein